MKRFKTSVRIAIVTQPRSLTTLLPSTRSWLSVGTTFVILESKESCHRILTGTQEGWAWIPTWDLNQWEISES